MEPLSHPDTIADGLRATLFRAHAAGNPAPVTAISTASDAAIAAAMRMIWERMKIVIEPSSAVPLACLLETGPPIEGKRVGIIVSGGNVDLDHLPWQ